jgi:hypothetical protein
MKNGIDYQASMDERSLAPDKGVAFMQNAQRNAQAPRQPAEKVWKPTGSPVGGCHIADHPEFPPDSCVPCQIFEKIEPEYSRSMVQKVTR